MAKDNNLSIPNNIPVVDKNGALTPAWLMWFNNLYQRVGKSESLTNTELEALALQNKEDLIVIDDKVNENSEEIEEVKTKNAEQDIEINNIKVDVTNNTNDINELESDVLDNTTQLNTLNNKVIDNSNKIIDLRSDVDENVLDINDLELQVIENTEDIIELQNNPSGSVEPDLYYEIRSINGPGFSTIGCSVVVQFAINNTTNNRDNLIMKSWKTDIEPSITVNQAGGVRTTNNTGGLFFNTSDQKIILEYQFGIQNRAYVFGYAGIANTSTNFSNNNFTAMTNELNVGFNYAATGADANLCIYMRGTAAVYRQDCGIEFPAANNSYYNVKFIKEKNDAGLVEIKIKNLYTNFEKSFYVTLETSMLNLIYFPRMIYGTGQVSLPRTNSINFITCSIYY